MVGIPLDIFRNDDEEVEAPKAAPKPPQRVSRKPVVPPEPEPTPMPHVDPIPDSAPQEKLLRPSVTKPDGKAEFYAKDLDWNNLQAGAQKYLGHITDEVPPLLDLTRKWARYTQLKKIYDEDKEQLLPDERVELKALHADYKKGAFKPLFDI